MNELPPHMGNHAVKMIPIITPFGLMFFTYALATPDGTAIELHFANQIACCHCHWSTNPDGSGMRIEMLQYTHAHHG